MNQLNAYVNRFPSLQRRGQGRFLSTSLLLAVFIMFIPALAQNTEDTPGKSMKQARPDIFITAETVNKVSSKKATITLVDIRRPDEYIKAHIPGSLNIGLSSIKTKPFLKDTTIVLVTQGYQYAQLDAECARLHDQGYSVSILMGGLNAWQQASYPLEGTSWVQASFDRITPEAFYQEQDYDHWVVIDATKKGQASKAFPGAIHFDPDTWLFATSRLKDALDKYGKDRPCLVLVVNEKGTDYQKITRTTLHAEVKNVFYLEGGLKAYEEYLKGNALSHEPKENRTKSIRKCPQCGEKTAG